MMRAIRRMRDSRDAGMSLAELLVYMILLALVITITGVFYVHQLVTQRDVTQRAKAANEGQVVIASIENSLRNAVKVKTPSDFDGRLLVVKTRVGDSDAASSFVCRGWLYDPTTKSIKTITGTPGPTAPTLGLTTASNFSAWKKIVLNAAPSSVSGVVQPIFTAEGTTGSQILFDIVGEHGTGRSTFKSAAIPRDQGTTVGAEACF